MPEIKAAAAIHSQRHAADGPDPITPGDIGAAPLAAIEGMSATVTGLPSGADPTVTVTGDLTGKTINLGIPRGADGPPGDPGMGYEEGQQLLAQNQATLDAAQAAEASASTAATDAANAIRDNLADDIATPGTPAYDALLSAAGTATDQVATELAARNRGAALVSNAAPPSQWWVQRRSEDAYNLVGRIDADRYWSWTLMRDYDNPGDFLSCVTGAYSLVGVPMTYAPFYEDTVFTGASWVQQSTLPGQAATEPHPGLMAGVIHIDALTVTAGNRNADALSWPGGVFPQALFRKLVVHGAGPGGGDLVTEVRNVVSDSVRIVMKADPLPAVSGVFPATVYPALTQSGGDDATATATWTSPPATRVGVSMAPAASGGIWAVTIDGDDFAANMAPTGRELLDAGYVTEADMAPTGPISYTKRYVDFYFSQSTPHRPVALATGLSLTSHTVTLSATGVYHRSGANCRALITGWAHGTEDTTPETPGADIYGQLWVTPEESAIEFAHGVTPGTGGTKTFLGSQHGWEDQTGPLDVRVDGATVDVAAATSVTGSAVTITRRSHLHHPEMTGVVADVTYQWELIQGRPLVASHRIEWRQAVEVAGYPVHCNVNSAEMPHAMVDTTGTVQTLVAGTDEYRGVGKNRTIAAWGDRVLWIESVPAVESATGGWNSHTGILHSIRDRAAGPGLRWGKTYMSRNGTVPAGQTWAASAEYSVALTFGDFTPPA